MDSSKLRHSSSVAKLLGLTARARRALGKPSSLNKARERARRVRQTEICRMCNSCGERMRAHTVTRVMRCLDVPAAA